MAKCFVLATVLLTLLPAPTTPAAFSITTLDSFLEGFRGLVFNDFQTPPEPEKKPNCSRSGAEPNLRPIVGILAQETSKKMSAVVGNKSYIAASYVKYLESAGARVVPILINQDEDYYRDITKYINGIVFPGGAQKITSESSYGRAGRTLYDLVIKAGNSNNPLPLWTTCLGFEMLMYLSGGRKKVLTSCRASNTADPLIKASDWNSSCLLGSAPEDIQTSLTTMNITSNFHKFCVTPQTFYDLNLDESYYLVSTNKDSDNIDYVSTVEHKTLPIYGTQWHPEKAAFEWGDTSKLNSIPHQPEAIKAAQHIINFFMGKVRENDNTYPSKSEEREALIYNYDAVYMIPFRPDYYSSFQQCYFFD